MVRHEAINGEWQIEYAAFSTSNSVIYQKDGEDMFGVIQSYYYPDSKPFFFETDNYGFRHGITKEKLNELINKIYKTNQK